MIKRELYVLERLHRRIIKLVLAMLFVLPISTAESFSVIAANFNAWNYNTNKISPQIWELWADVIVFIEWSGVSVDREKFGIYCRSSLVETLHFSARL
jgi:hypothetical protein